MSHSNPDVYVVYDGPVEKLRIEQYYDSLLVHFIVNEHQVATSFRFELDPRFNSYYRKMGKKDPYDGFLDEYESSVTADKSK